MGAGLNPFQAVNQDARRKALQDQLVGNDTGVSKTLGQPGGTQTPVSSVPTPLPPPTSTVPLPRQPPPTSLSGGTKPGFEPTPPELGGPPVVYTNYTHAPKPGFPDPDGPGDPNFPNDQQPPGANAPAPSNIGPYANRLVGFDQQKLTSSSSPKYQIARVLSHYDQRGGLTPALLADLNALGLGTFTSNGRDTVTITNGDPAFGGVTEIDLIQGFSNGGEAWQFGINTPGVIDPKAVVGGQAGTGGTATGTVPNVGGGIPGAGGGGTVGGGTGGGTTTGGSTPNVNQAFQDQLLRILGGPTPDEAGANAGQSGAASAFRLQAQRNEERDRGFVAERNAQSGVSGSGAADADVLGLRQARGESETGFVGQLAMQEKADRRQELQHAMTLAQQLGDNEAARRVQLQIAEIDKQLRQAAIDLQGQLGFGAQALDWQKFLENLGIAQFNTGQGGQVGLIS